MISLDGKTLYVSNFDERGLAVFRIDATSGALTPLAGTDHCITNDGDSSEGAATCADGRGFDRVRGAHRQLRRKVASTWPTGPPGWWS